MRLSRITVVRNSSLTFPRMSYGGFKKLCHNIPRMGELSSLTLFPSFPQTSSSGYFLEAAGAQVIVLYVGLLEEGRQKREVMCGEAEDSVPQCGRAVLSSFFGFIYLFIYGYSFLHLDGKGAAAFFHHMM